jgi:hypothetical protein
MLRLLLEAACALSWSCASGPEQGLGHQKFRRQLVAGVSRRRVVRRGSVADDGRGGGTGGARQEARVR